jgi:predicted enzyme related to lactoylglutathione lyase
MSQVPGKFVWFEHLSDDPAKAQAFYTALCGWSTQNMPMGGASYALIDNRGQGIGGFRSAGPGTTNHWTGYLSVPDVDRAHAAAVAAGATSVMAPMDFGDVGRGSVLADPTGATFSLWKGSRPDAPDTDVPPQGGWAWHELTSTDVKAAVAFYEKVFGYTHDENDMGAMGTYYMLKDAKGIARAGAMQMPPGVPAPSHWLPYIMVADVDAATRKAHELGAQATLVPPSDIPGIGRFSILKDAVGAPVALFTGSM